MGRRFLFHRTRDYSEAADVVGLLAPNPRLEGQASRTIDAKSFGPERMRGGDAAVSRVGRLERLPGLGACRPGDGGGGCLGLVGRG